MASGYRNSAGVDSDDLYDPDVVGDGYTATFLRRSDGSPLRYASASYGTPGDPFGYRDNGGADVGPRWAKKGTAQYSIPFATDYFANSQVRGNATLTLNMNNNGTWTVTRFTSQSSGSGTVVVDSGTWLPSGGSVSDYTCMFAYTVNSSNTTGDGGNNVVNGAATQSALTTTRSFTVNSSAPITGDKASQTIGITVTLYKNGVLKSTSQTRFSTNVNGN